MKRIVIASLAVLALTLAPRAVSPAYATQTKEGTVLQDNGDGTYTACDCKCWPIFGGKIVCVCICSAR